MTCPLPRLQLPTVCEVSETLTKQEVPHSQYAGAPVYTVDMGSEQVTLHPSCVHYLLRQHCPPFQFQLPHTAQFTNGRHKGWTLHSSESEEHPAIQEILY